MDLASEDAVIGVDVSVWSRALTDSEMICMREHHDVRHVIVGTQDHRIARQQLETAVRSGMSVDAYVFLYWDQDIETQVRDAWELVREFPIGLLWLDIEDNPGRRSAGQLEDLIADGVETCLDLGAPCGVYTSSGWWSSYMAGSEAFADLPLWDARYDGIETLERYQEYRYGGWEEAFGRQWEENSRPCGVLTDMNTIRVARAAAVPYAPEEGPSGEAPDPPNNLYPNDFLSIPIDGVRLLSHRSPGATEYEVQVESHSGTRWVPYFTYRTDTNAKFFSPSLHHRPYRFRMRGRNIWGWSEWSDWGTFLYGRATAPEREGGEVEDPPVEDPPVEDPPGSDPPGSDPPGSDPPVEDPPVEDPPGSDPPGSDPPVEDPPVEDPPGSDPPGSDPPGSDPPEDPPVGGFSPTGGDVVTTPSVTLTYDGVAGASGYEHAIENDTGSGFRPYYTYSGSSPSRTFYPVANAVYRWRVRADGGAWSDYQTFVYEGR